MKHFFFAASLLLLCSVASAQAIEQPQTSSPSSFFSEIFGVLFSETGILQTPVVLTIALVAVTPILASRFTRTVWPLLISLFSTQASRSRDRELNLQRSLRSQANEIEKLKNLMQSEVKRLEGLEHVTEGTAQYEKLKDELIASVTVEDFVASNKTSLLQALSLSQVRKEFEDIKINLVDYRKSLRSQYITTLLVGGILGLVPIWFALNLLNAGQNGNYIDANGNVLWPNLFGFYVPWITIILVIQFLSIFFLKLYRNTIEMDRHLRNEITTIGMKASGIELALMQDEATSISKISKMLLQADRHQILSSGQTTVELEKARFDQEALKESAEFFSGLIPKVPQPKKQKRSFKRK